MDNSPLGPRPPLVVVIEDCECFQTKVLQELISIMATQRSYNPYFSRYDLLSIDALFLFRNIVITIILGVSILYWFWV